VVHATYRVQLVPEQGFDAVRASLPYLQRLGVSHLYLSPVFQSRPGSTHGYDVVDHSCIDPQLGGRAGFDALARECSAHDMGLVLDIVPNHMAVLGVANAWWNDVLENGPASRFAGYFDIDWLPVRHSMRNRLLVPVLGAPLGEVIESGGIHIAFRPEAGTFHAVYADHQLPLEPRTFPLIFRAAAPPLERGGIADHAIAREFASLLDAFAALAPPVAADDATLQVRARDQEVHRARLARLCVREPAVRQFIEAALSRLNADPALLAQLLQAQPWRMAYWRVSGEEINYRRFFDVNELAALRMEDAAVFADTHSLLRELWHERLVDGVRVDHADGLYDPAEYFRRLRDLMPADEQGRRPWLLAEKILGPAERLPDDWCVDGTTGYEFGALVSGWLSHASGVDELDHTWRRFVGGGPDYPDVVYQCKKLVMHASLAAEVSGLAARLDRLAQMHVNTSDFTLFDLRAAIVEMIACFPVYRTYFAPGRQSNEDVQIVRRAIGAAYGRRRGARRALDFLQQVLLGELQGEDAGRRAAALAFTQKFQQVTAPVMAKGVEDTAFYRFARFLAMNEVGSDPDARGVSTDALHRANEERARDWPRTMLSTSTHDSKRGEDVRFRLCVLSEIPHEWAVCVSRWRRLKRPRGSAAPDPAQEYLLLQTLLGIWPVGVEDTGLEALRMRIGEFAIKSAREAKQQTSWLDADAEVEAGLQGLVERMVPGKGGAGFERYFRGVIDRVAYCGMLNSVTAVVLKLTAPGIPDLYQGTELPAFTLVDPDNRRPVDMDTHAAQLGQVEQLAVESPAGAATQLLRHWQDGRIKLLVTWILLRLRARRAAAFEGEYLALGAQGTRADHLCAHARLANQASILVVVSRWFAILLSDALQLPLGEACWGDTAIALPDRMPAGRYVDALTGSEHAIGTGGQRLLHAAALLQILPWCVLVRQEEG